MKPLRLSLSAFGPFGHRETIDFDALAKDLFLITGPIGAGKTSILDGICFALFGKTSGGDREIKHMRSHFAEEGLATEIVFDFSLNGESYRVYRPYEQARTKKAAAKQSFSATTLWKCSLETPLGEGDLIATTDRKVDEKIHDLIGLSRDEFCQVVLLPQGKFQTFLRANSGERESLLKTLFRTEGSERIQRLLQEEADAIAKDLEQKEMTRASLVGAHGAADEPMLETIRAEIAALEEAVSLARARREQASAKLDRAKQEVAIYTRAMAAAKTLETCRKQHEEAALRLERATSALKDSQRIFESVELKRKETVSDEITLASLKQKEPRLLERQAVESVIDQKKAEISTLQARLKDFQARLDEIRRLKPKLEAHRAFLDKNAKERELESTRAIYEKAEAEARSVRARVEDLESRWIAGQAAILAKNLKEGEACAVCGSTQHPAPKQIEGVLPTESLIKLEKEKLASRIKASETALLARERTQSEYSTALALCSSFENQPELTPEESSMSFEELSLREAKGVEKTSEVEKLLLATEQAKTKAEGQLAAVLAALGDEKLSLAEIAPAMASLEQKIAAFRKLEREAQASRETARAAAAAAEASHVASAARLAEAEMAAKSEPLPAAEPEARGEERARAEVTETSAAYEKAIRAVEARKAALAAIEASKAKLGAIDAEIAALEQRHKVVGNLSNVANGINSYRINFHRYLLAAKLERVLDSASRRLSMMSRGRYSLARADGQEDRRKVGGLDLSVVDSRTGQIRPASTLSGGETFLASLALALSLSDAVQARSGGRKLDTLFIDEGFGSLDLESMDLAMETLRDLQRGDRMVGIISHVEELKRQIGPRIEVLSEPKGSSVRVFP